MSSPSHEQLLGYVLGSLEPGEQAQIEQEVAANPQLAYEAEQLAARLKPLEVGREVEGPPAGLAARACAYVFAHDDVPTAAPSRYGLPQAMSAEYGASSSSWSLTDMVVAAGIFLAAGMLFFPAIANSRYQARMAQCQNNLRHVGFGMQQLQAAHPERDMNNICLQPEHAMFAGSQAPQLCESGAVEPRHFLCPSSPEALQKDWRMPTMKELIEATGPSRAQLRRMAGGSLAFSLGTLPSAKMTPPDSEYYVLVSDAPSGQLPDMVSSHHDGRGENVVFKSGRVAYICGCGTKECGDSFFSNRNGELAPGLDYLDVVLARSGTVPLVMPVSNQK